MNTAAEIHALFQGLPGADHIASEFAIRVLQVALWTHQPRRILEVGGGIGTLSWVVADYLTYLSEYAEAVVVEDDPWCRTQWGQNMARWRQRPTLFDKIPVYEFYDLVVLDGDQMPSEGWACLAPRAIVFVEGNRRAQRARLRQYLTNVGRPFCETPNRPQDRSKGVWMIRCEPAWWERVLFFTNRIEQWLRDLPASVRRRPIGQRLALLLVAMVMLSGCAAAGIAAGAISAASDVVGIVKWWQDRTFQEEANAALKAQTEAIKALEAEIGATRKTLHEDLEAVQRVLKPGP